MSMLEDMRIIRLFPRVRHVTCCSAKMKDLRELVGLDELASVSVRSESTPLRSLEVLPHLNLRRLAIDAWSEEDAAYIGRCGGRLDSIWITRWPFADIDRLTPLQVGELRMTNAAVKSTDGLNDARLSLIWFSRCSELSTFHAFRVPRIRIEACTGVKFESIGYVKELVSLRLSGMGNLRSLEFIGSCRWLRSLHITATKLPVDCSPIYNSETLRLAWLGIPNSDLIHIGEKNPSLVLGNGKISVVRGAPAGATAYEVAARQLSETA